MFKLNGQYNSAKIMVESKDDVEKNCLDQIKEMINHPAFEGNDNVVIQPDTHWGAGAVIGFTMPLGNRVCPNTIGVDIGCGMTSVKIPSLDAMEMSLIDEKIRESVPTGFNIHDRGTYHMLNDFPWYETGEKFVKLANMLDLNICNEYQPNTHEYFQEVCDRVDYDEGRAINSIGTLGGGNHFIEIGEDKNGDWWITVHSGSRGFGHAIAQYWQDKATEKRNSDNDYDFDRKQLEELARKTFEGGKIGEVIHYLHQMQETIDNPDRNTDLDYLEGKEALGYYKDMVLAQTYASENRKTMIDNICNELNIEPIDMIESTHNFIDFEDGVIRKGATRAHGGERAIIPLNMSDGVLLVEGKGNEDWNKSVCHGAGRVLGRREAERILDMKDVKEDMDGIYTSAIPIDEAPDAYKPSSMIKENIKPTADIINHIKPILNIKDDS